MREIEHEAAEIGGENFGGGERRQRAGRRFLPKAIANARLDAPRPAPPLIDIGARRADGLQPRQPEIGLEHRHARKPAVDHDAHAVDGQRSLGDRGGEHDLAPARRRFGDGAVLLGAIQRAVKRREIDVGGKAALGQQRGDAGDFALPRQKDQDGALFLGQRPPRGAGDLLLDADVGIAAEIARLDRKGPARALDDGGRKPSF